MSVLAIDGGRPAHPGPWPQWPPAPAPDQRALLEEVVASGAWGSTSGPLCDRFANRFAAAHGVEHGVALTNGTLALFVALQAAGIGPGDEVVVPGYTFIACATSVLLAGATPVIADVDPDHLHLSGETLEAAVGERTRAVMVVHLAGSPAPMRELTEVAAREGLVVVEDAAQAHGARYRDAPVGSLGDMGTFSFQSSKAMTAGEGGLVVSRDRELADRAWSLCNVGRERGGAWYHHATVGWNLRMTEFQAALLLPWLDRLDDEIAARERFARAFARSLDDAGIGAAVLPDPEGTTRSSHHLLMVDLGDDVDRSWAAAALAAEGVPVDLGYPALGSVEAVARHARVLPTPGLGARAERTVWLRQPMLMAAEDDAAQAGEAFARVLGDRRATGVSLQSRSR